MATKIVTVEVSTTISLTMNGTNTVSGSFRWTPPTAPAGGTLQKIHLAGTWQWTGKQTVTWINIAGTQTTSRTSFDLQVSTTAVSQLSVTAKGGHKNCTGSSWTNDVKAVYYYEVEVTEAMYFKANGSWVEATKCFIKTNGAWVETAPSAIPQKNWVKGT